MAKRAKKTKSPRPSPRRRLTRTSPRHRPPKRRSSRRSSDLRLLLMIPRHEAAFEELLTGLLDVGIMGATIVDSRGLGAILRQEMPMFVGLASLLPQTTGSKIVLSLTGPAHIKALRQYISELPEDDQPIVIVLNVAEAFGPIRRENSD